MSETEIDLSLVPTKVLATALLKRADVGVLSMLQLRDKRHFAVLREWHGNIHIALGLAAELQHLIARDLVRSTEGTEPPDGF